MSSTKFHHNNQYITSINKMRAGSLTIPAQIRKQAKWNDGHCFQMIFDKKNQYIYIQSQENGIKDQSVVELSERGEKMLKEARNDIKKGKIFGPYNNSKSLLKDLKK